MIKGIPEVAREEKHLPANQAAPVERPSQLRECLLQLSIRACHVMSAQHTAHGTPPNRNTTHASEVNVTVAKWGPVQRREKQGRKE